MGPIVAPDALTLNVLARRDSRRSTDNYHQIAVATDFDPQNAKAGLLTMEGHTLHSTGQLFCRMGEG